MVDKPVNPWLVLGAIVAPILMVPAALVVLAFGERPDTAESGPVVTLAAEPVAADCVMFCEPVLAAPATTAPSAPSESPNSGFMRNEPPLPSGGELCRLFCDLGPWR
ncbi:hypothetical protein FOH10_09125 [Nocardia otitidiscaviarum]|uniref:Uncharacterized protein n=1 Tax=Nocardia otitidiscaviarum TaxID=1823 RepID=A0A516NIZ4_9NOCA|nr:hypothetical protein [Nocardia otitidiscaviarum]MCP9619682.1 hypothetical protein [Nocardia otitidiscaviarum]QDP78875.1 hypothetical protein FOH10_09125 [Nocardia otitidiscaviarum]